MKWIKRTPKKEFDEDDLLIEKLAKIRGINNLKEWINPPKKYLHSPYSLKNIDMMVEILIKAIHRESKIQIVPDIDTDGVNSFAIMYNYLSQLTNNLSYVHAQRSEGHGVEKVLDKIDEDTELVLIVDSSSNSIEACRKLREKGIEVLIIDHHEMDVVNDYAVLVNCQDGSYPNKNLSGSAMCYKVCQVLDEYLGVELADDFVDLATVGLVGDMMSVWNMENRCIINDGLSKIKNLGIQEILKQSNIDYSKGITTTNISFKIAPIIGACSRFDKIELALELLTTEDEDRAKELTEYMIAMNENRKKEQKSSVNNAIEGLKTDDNLVIVVTDDIDSGFRGLVATEIVELYSRPVFVLKAFKDEEGNVIKYSGSARSVGQLPLKELCEESGYFVFATGHSQAFGVEFEAKHYDDIVKHFNDTLSDKDMEKVVYYDMSIDVEDIDEMDILDVEKFARIVGQGFAEPRFLIKGVIVEEANTKKLGDHVRAVMGSNKDTVKINCENEFALMKFRSNSEYGIDIEEHFNDNFITELEVVGTLNLNIFYNWGLRQNVTTKQVFLSDYRIK